MRDSQGAYLVTVQSLTEPGQRQQWQVSTQDRAGALQGATEALAAEARSKARQALHSAIRAYLATLPARDRYRRRYFEMRRAGWLAQYAYRAARSHVALSYAEGTGAVIFDWLPDGDYEPYDDDPEFLRQEIANLQSGKWEALGCVASVPADRHTGETLGSLWGVVIGSSQDDDYYRRDVEIDLAIEADILPDDVWRAWPHS